MRRCPSSAVSWWLAVALLCWLLPARAQAYMDPGTGSYLLQMLIAGLLGAGYAVKLFWRQIKAFFSRLFSRRPSGPGGTPDAP